jgi:hypothetical protein
MPDSPDIVLAVLGALLLLVAIAGRVEAEKLRIGLSTTRSRLLAGVLGAGCLSLSIGLYFHRAVAPETNRMVTTGPRDSVGSTPVETMANDPEQDQNSPPQIEGQWNVTVNSTHRIVWRLKVSLADDELSARGPKLFVDGQPATVAEQETNLILRGTLSGRTVKGRYTENQPLRETGGDFEATFSGDGLTLEGVLFTPSGRSASRITGVRTDG